MIIDLELNIEQQKLVEKARVHCESSGNRFTPIRERVFSLMISEEKSIGAYDLLDKLRETEENAKPPTVYRALDFFLGLGLVHKVESTNTYKACHHFDCSHPVQFLICECCGDVQEIQSEGVKKTLDEQAQRFRFNVKSQTIEARGICHDCHNCQKS